jgi:hypothetical protein
LALKATPKAVDILAEQEDRELSKVDKVKLTWKCYAPAAIGYCASAACIIGANSVNTKRNAVLAGAYKLSESALLEYRDKVKEVIGEEKEKEIHAKMAEDRRCKEPENQGNVILTGKGDVLCYDMYSGRYFKSEMDEINAILNELNYKLMQDNLLALNDFYDALGLQPIITGYDHGWNVDDGLIKIYFTSTLADNGIPCLALHFDNLPRYGYDRLG